MPIKIPRGWELPEREATPEAIYRNRREVLRWMGFTGLGLMGLLSGSAGASPGKTASPPPDPTRGLYPAPRSGKYTLDRPLTEETVAAAYNNFYEFTTDKSRVAALARGFPTRPWQVEVAGLVKRPRTLDIDDLIRMCPLEERLYRFRCVEAWSMAVPWTGIPMAAFIRKLEPTPAAKYVRFLTFLDPERAPGQKSQSWYPWPYFEGLTLAEAMNELTLLVTGIYGRPLPMQHGAPLRLIVPWKYGFKSIKSIVRIEFTRTRPATFWNTLAPKEYDFRANVNPKVPHPRWSQATERVIGTGERRPTLPYNGYGEFVAGLYPKA